MIKKIVKTNYFILNNFKNKVLNINKKIVFFAFIYCFSVINSFALCSESIKENKSDPQLTVDYFKKEIQNDYIVGPGDVLRIILSREIPKLTDIYTIDSSGTINLPKLNRIYISGLTIYELTNLLNKELANFLKYPNPVIEILKYRPIRVFIDGEVVGPGFYNIEGASNDSSESSIYPYLDNSDLMLKDNYPSNSSNSFPTLYDVIKKSGGITPYSNLRNVKVIRKLSRNRGLIQAEIDFMQVILNGSSANNLRIFDGDVIKIEKSENLLIDDISNAIKLNINPKFIDVFVTGRVERAGQTRLGKLAYLNEAIMVAGIKKLRGKIIFRRINIDGTIDSRRFKFSKNSPEGSYKNPQLRNGDLIIVDKSLINVTNEIIGEITKPFIGIYSSIKLFD